MQENKTLKDVWDKLPEGEHIHKLFDERTGLRMYQVCGKKFQETVRINYILPILQKFYDVYGKRAKLAKENKFLDWKAISHAVRFGEQIKELFITGDIKFPLANSEYIKQVKAGELHFIKEVAPYLDELLGEIGVLADSSTFPEEPDTAYWNKFLFDYHRYIVDNRL